MYLAPLNYDRYFKKVFADTRIAKRFLEDFLNVTIDSLEPLPLHQRVTDEAAIVEFDYRCKIGDGYVIVDMQQWYKSDIVQRFYLYHALNTGLQLEKLPHERIWLDQPTRKTRKGLDYAALEPALTLVWLVDETLHFTENYVTYTMAPELVLEFVQNEKLWHKPEILELLRERERVLKVATNRTKQLDFLQQNRLIFLLQKNIVKQGHGEQYEKWFRFAERSRNHENEEGDFEEFRGDEIFEEMMRRLNKSMLTNEDWSYIEDEAESWREVERWERGYYESGKRDGRREGRAEGHAAGQLEGKRETARKMLAKGFSIAEVVELTGLSLAELTNLEE